LAGITSNAGTVSISAPDVGSVSIANNTGELSITGDFTGAFTTPSPGINAGTITITDPDTIGGTITVTNNTASGVINLNSETSVSGAVTVTTNSGKLNYATPAIATAASTVRTNIGEINFTQDFTPTVTNFLKVPANRGVINFKGDLTNGTGIALGSNTPGDSISGPGKVIFGGSAAFGAATIIGSDTEFNAGLTKNTAGGLTLNGDVTLAYEQAIFLDDTTDTLTLGAGKKILVGTTPVLAAGSSPVVLTPSGSSGVVLTAGTELPGDEDDPETFVGNKALTLDTEGITVTSGELKVPGALIVNIAAGVKVDGALTLEAGGILGFPNNAAAENFIVAFGDTQIAGVNDLESRLIASGGPVTLAPNKISGGGSTLTVVPNLAGPVITVDPTPLGGKTLTLAGVDLDLYGDGSGFGSLVISGNASPNKVILSSGQQNPGKITLGQDTLYTLKNLTGKTLADDATLSGGGVVLGDSEVFPTTVGELSATDASNLTITGASVAGTDVTLTAGVSGE
jgi:hypothetical protein